jgi:hypothetical protein
VVELVHTKLVGCPLITLTVVTALLIIRALAQVFPVCADKTEVINKAKIKKE